LVTLTLDPAHSDKAPLNNCPPPLGSELMKIILITKMTVMNILFVYSGPDNRLDAFNALSI
jgi:hypothetical protein